MSKPLAAIRSALTRSPVGRLWRRLRPAPIATPDTLKTFLQERAFLIAQKCAIDYCRGKTGLASYALFTEKPFLDALDVCRWEAFAAVLGDLLILVEGELRAHVGYEQRVKLRETLAAMFSSILAAQPVPAHRAHGWGDVIAAFGTRLEAAGRGEPPQALDVADHSAKRLFETLPIHSSYRELDEEVVYGAVRFRMIAFRQEMQRRIAAEDLTGKLTA
jgi:hypothetical protein